jgi:hypothetical protein
VKNVLILLGLPEYFKKEADVAQLVEHVIGGSHDPAHSKGNSRMNPESRLIASLRPRP